MDFGGFFVWIILGLVVIAGLATTLARHFQGDRVGAKNGAIATALCGLVLALWSGFLYREFGLNEPLAIAAGQGEAQTVKDLLKRGASPNALFESESALERAKRNGHREVVRILEEAGAR